MSGVEDGPAPGGRRRRFAFVAAAVVILIAASAALASLALISADSGGRPAPEPIYLDSTAIAVEIYSAHYVPAIISVPTGALITWTNHDTDAHSATASGGAWDTGLMGQDAVGTVTLNAAGVYHYTCSLHPHMHGEITVRP